MGGARQHFGHDPKEEGRQAAHAVAEGRMSKEELKERYKDAKFRGDGDRFKEGYAGGAGEVFDD